MNDRLLDLTESKKTSPPRRDHCYHDRSVGLDDFLLPLNVLADQTNQTIPMAQHIFQSQFTSNYPMAFASYLMAMAPVLIVYVFAQKWAVDGVMRGAVNMNGLVAGATGGDSSSGADLWCRVGSRQVRHLAKKWLNYVAISPLKDLLNTNSAWIVEVFWRGTGIRCRLWNKRTF